MKRFLAAVGLAAMLGALVVVEAVPASADCGWPYCNPAQIAGSVYPTITPPNGSSGTEYVHFASNVYYPSLETWASFSGNSTTQWWGCCPWNANTVELTDQFMVSGLGVSVSVPPSIGLSGSGSSATYSTTNYNVWLNSHSYSGIDFNAFDIYQVGQNTCGNMQFSWAWFNHCTGSHWVLI